MLELAARARLPYPRASPHISPLFHPFLPFPQGPSFLGLVSFPALVLVHVFFPFPWYGHGLAILASCGQPFPPSQYTLHHHAIHPPSLCPQSHWWGRRGPPQPTAERDIQRFAGLVSAKSDLEAPAAPNQTTHGLGFAGLEGQSSAMGLPCCPRLLATSNPLGWWVQQLRLY